MGGGNDRIHDAGRESRTAFFQLTSSQEEVSERIDGEISSGRMPLQSDAGKESAGARPYFAEICESSGIYRM